MQQKFKLSKFKEIIRNYNLTDKMNIFFFTNFVKTLEKHEANNLKKFFSLG